MKKLLLLTGLLSTLAAAEIDEKYNVISTSECSEEAIQAFQNFTNDPDFETLIKDLKENNLVFKVKEGDVFPFKVTCSGTIFDISGAEDIAITCKQDLYIKLEEEDALISAGEDTWYTAEDFFTGRLDASCTEEGLVRVHLDLNIREHN